MSLQELKDTDFVCPNCQKKEAPAPAGIISQGVLNQLRPERPQKSGLKAGRPSKVNSVNRLVSLNKACDQNLF